MKKKFFESFISSSAELLWISTLSWSQSVWILAVQWSSATEFDIMITSMILRRQNWDLMSLSHTTSMLLNQLIKKENSESFIISYSVMNLMLSLLQLLLHKLHEPLFRKLCNSLQLPQSCHTKNWIAGQFIQKQSLYNQHLFFCSGLDLISSIDNTASLLFLILSQFYLISVSFNSFMR